MRETTADPSNLWQWRRANPVRRRDRFFLAVLSGTGVLAVLRFADWWFAPQNVANPGLFVVLSIALWYGISRMLLGWVNVLAIRRPPHRPAPKGLSVAIFTTSSPGEPPEMF